MDGIMKTLILRQGRSFFIFSLLSFLWGCADIAPIAKEGQCRNTAMYCAQLFDEVQVSQLVVGTRKGTDQKHMQARTYQNGKWEWLQFDGGTCFVGREEFELEDVGYMSVLEAIVYLDQFFPNIMKGGSQGGLGPEGIMPTGF